MEKEDCIAIAKSIEVRALETSDGGLGGLVEPLRTFHMSEIQLQKFANLVEQATLERVAKVCDEKRKQGIAWQSARAIRALKTNNV